MIFEVHILYSHTCWGWFEWTNGRPPAILVGFQPPGAATSVPSSVLKVPRGQRTHSASVVAPTTVLYRPGESGAAFFSPANFSRDPIGGEPARPVLTWFPHAPLLVSQLQGKLPHSQTQGSFFLDLRKPREHGSGCWKGRWLKRMANQPVENWHRPPVKRFL